MPIGKHTDPQIKADIIHEIRNNGLPVVSAADKYNVNSKTIYNWLRTGVVDSSRNLILENNRLKKELEIAYRIIGRATAEMQRSKK
jgi:transposase-like protein